MTQEPVDYLVRQQAIDPDLSIILQAPAGSGKTALLTARVLKLLATKVMSPEEILALTFTKKAANEMQSRIIGALEDAKSNQPITDPYQEQLRALAHKVLQKDQHYNWHLLEQHDRLRIMTIDSFAHQIVAQLPLAQDMTVGANILASPQCYYQKAVQQCLSDLDPSLSWHDALYNLIHYMHNNYDYLETLLCQLLASREQWLDLLYSSKHHQDLEPFVAESLKIAQTLFTKALDNMLEPFLKKRLFSIATICYRALYQQEFLEQSLFSRWQFIADIFLKSDGALRKKFTKKLGFNSQLLGAEEKKAMQETIALIGQQLDENQSFLALLETTSKLPSSMDEVQQKMITAVIEVLPIMVAQLYVLFKKDNVCDFNQIAILAYQAIAQDHHALAHKLDYQIHHVLVDEFQDTSLLQFKFFSAMAKNMSQSTEKSFFLVGDPMQSIYRFRQADVALFQQAIDEGIGGIKLKHLQLSCNFRSTETIIHWVNTHFAQIMPQTSQRLLGAMPYSNSVSTKKSQAGSGVYQDFVLERERTAQAQKVVEDILAYRRENPDKTMALLVRNRGQLAKIMPFLEQHQLPVCQVDIIALQDALIIRDLLSLCYALDDQSDRLSWLALLRSPIIGLSLKQLHYLSDQESILASLKEDKFLALLPKELTQRIQDFYLIMHQAQALKGQLPIIHLIQHCAQALDIKSAYGNATSGDYLESFFMVFQSLLANHVHLPARDEIKAHLQGLFLQSKEQAGPGVLQIMTIHKAKGLEFDAVWMPFLEQAGRSQSGALMRFLAMDAMVLFGIYHQSKEQKHSLYQFLSILNKHKQAFELQRLFYVGCTRAISDLFLYGNYSQNSKNIIAKPVASSFLSLLDKNIDKESLAVAQEVKTEYALPEKNLISVSAAQTVFDVRALDALKEYLPKKSTILQNPPASLKSDSWIYRQLGVIGHSFLQQAMNHQQLFSNVLAISQYFDAQCAPYHFEPQVMQIIHQQMVPMGKRFIEIIAKPGGIFDQSHPIWHTEYGFSTLEKQQLKQHQIDYWFINKEGELWIIDYKFIFDQHHFDNDQDYDQFKQQHQAQLFRYCTHLQQTYKNTPIYLALYLPMQAKLIKYPSKILSQKDSLISN